MVAVSADGFGSCRFPRVAQDRFVASAGGGISVAAFLGSALGLDGGPVVGDFAAAAK